jgi:hypothetical protein
MNDGDLKIYIDIHKQLRKLCNCLSEDYRRGYLKARIAMMEEVFKKEGTLDLARRSIPEAYQGVY